MSFSLFLLIRSLSRWGTGKKKNRSWEFPSTSSILPHCHMKKRAGKQIDSPRHGTLLLRLGNNWCGGGCCRQWSVRKTVPSWLQTAHYQIAKCLENFIAKDEKDLVCFQKEKKKCFSFFEMFHENGKMPVGTRTQQHNSSITFTNPLAHSVWVKPSSSCVMGITPVINKIK